jgi:hypothetical protein
MRTSKYGSENRMTGPAWAPSADDCLVRELEDV